MIAETLEEIASLKGVIVDLACGDGRIANALAQKGVQDVVGIDITSSQVEKARQADKTQTVAYQIGDWNKLPLADKSAKLAVDVGRNTQNRKDREEFAESIAEVARVLVPGGVYLFDSADPNLGRYAEDRKKLLAVYRSLLFPLEKYGNEEQQLTYIEHVVSTPDGKNFNSRLVLQPETIRGILEGEGFSIEEIERAEIPGWEGAQNVYYKCIKKG